MLNTADLSNKEKMRKDLCTYQHKMEATGSFKEDSWGTVRWAWHIKRRYLFFNAVGIEESLKCFEQGSMVIGVTKRY